MEAVATVMALRTGMVRATAARTRCSCRACALNPCPPPSSQLHPNPNLKNPDPAVDLNIVVGATAQKHPVRPGRRARPHCLLSHRMSHASSLSPPRQVDVALSNSFGFGGHNSCILFTTFKP